MVAMAILGIFSLAKKKDLVCCQVAVGLLQNIQNQFALLGHGVPLSIKRIILILLYLIFPFLSMVFIKKTGKKKKKLFSNRKKYDTISAINERLEEHCH